MSMNAKEALQAMLTTVEAHEESLEAGFAAAKQAVEPVFGTGLEQSLVTDLGELLDVSEGQGVERQYNSNPAFALGALLAAFEQQGRLSIEEPHHV